MLHCYQANSVIETFYVNTVAQHKLPTKKSSGNSNTMNDIILNYITYLK